jgi:hypothetical protein
MRKLCIVGIATIVSLALPVALPNATSPVRAEIVVPESITSALAQLIPVRKLRISLVMFFLVVVQGYFSSGSLPLMQTRISMKRIK